MCGVFCSKLRNAEYVVWHTSGSVHYRTDIERHNPLERHTMKLFTVSLRNPIAGLGKRHNLMSHFEGVRRVHEARRGVIHSGTLSSISRDMWASGSRSQRLYYVLVLSKDLMGRSSPPCFLSLYDCHT